MKQEIKNAIKESRFYLFGAGFASIFVLLTATNPLHMFFVLLVVHTVIFSLIVTMVILVDRKRNNHD